uniref:Uncharacterized protein n=1 Tax=Caenorhabditis japonica TaxID=281687 RepID=A0A8R1HTY4_CAEJA
MKKCEGVKLRKEDSDEWLCSSTYKPNKSEIVGNSEERKTSKKKKLKVIVPPRIVQSTPRFERTKNGIRRIEAEKRVIADMIDDTDDVELLNMVPERKVVTPKIPSKSLIIRRSINDSPLEVRQSPEQIFASLTPKRRRSLDIVQPEVKRRKEKDKEDEEDANEEKDPFLPEQDQNNFDEDDSDVSNIFDNLSPIKFQSENGRFEKEKEDIMQEFSSQKSKFSLNFISGYDAQFSVFERPNDSPDLFEDGEPLSIHEESEAKELDGSPFKIDTSPEKRKLVKFVDEAEIEDNEKKNISAKKTLRFTEPEEPSAWRREEIIDETCEHYPQSSVFREYAIDMETCGYNEEESCLPDYAQKDTQKYTEAAESCAYQPNPNTTDNSDHLLDEELYERSDLTGLAARFASLMSSKSSERRVLMSDVTFGMVPRNKIVKLEQKRQWRSSLVFCSLSISKT